ncbi:Gfo/Idh/MocA family protein [Bacillus sp. B1-b2]|uniref:Gfo/Idh/MocA family protein n=1 Tax=Bacillus sp. B1-b2 TaxID=2653201 RepID=UPI001D024178|nr:Gfo/Idh/MocA family oxidoreductase [Bacillus sp. B1-b2]
MTIRKLRYGIIGAGSNAERKHLNNYMNIPNVELVSICDVNIESANRLANKYNITNIYNDYMEMLVNEELDLISVCTPNYTHEEITIQALMQGIHVHCEKPLAVNADSAKKIVEAKNKSGKLVMVGLNNRFTKEALTLKSFIDRGCLGEIYRAKAGWSRRSGIPGRGTWFTNKDFAGGGVMIDLGVHYLDLALYLMGMPNPTYVTGSTYNHFNNSTNRNRNGYRGNLNGVFDVEDTAIGFMGLNNGASVQFEFSWASNIEKDVTKIELLGTKGGASLINGELKIYSEIADTCVNITPILDSTSHLMNEFDHFVQCILHGEELISPAEHGVYMMEIIDQFYESAIRKEPIHLS